MSTPAPKRNKKSKAPKTPWQVHGGALVDHLGKSGIERLKTALGLNTEENYIDASTSTTTSTTGASKLTFPTIPQGTSVGQRIGSSIRLTRIEFRLQVTAQAAATTANSIRVLMTRNKDPGAAQATDILQTATDITSPLNHIYKEKGLQLLLDEVINVDPAGNGSCYRTWIIDDRAMNNMHVQYPDTDTAGLASSILEGQVNVFWYADSVTTSPVFTGKVRFCYVDN